MTFLIFVLEQTVDEHKRAWGNCKRKFNFQFVSFTTIECRYWLVVGGGGVLTVTEGVITP